MEEERARYRAHARTKIRFQALRQFERVQVGSSGFNPTDVRLTNPLDRRLKAGFRMPRQSSLGDSGLAFGSAFFPYSIPMSASLRFVSAIIAACLLIQGLAYGNSASTEPGPGSLVSAADVVTGPSLRVTNLVLTAHMMGDVSIPESRVFVPPLEEVTLFAPLDWGPAYQWTRNGATIEGAVGNRLGLGPAGISSGGRYALVSDGGKVSSSVTLSLAALSRVNNFSVRSELMPGRDVGILGFVIEGEASKSFLLRAVGPSLRQFGIQTPASLPRMRLFDSDGKEVPLTDVLVSNIEAFFPRVGAFPLPGGERPGIAVRLASLMPGGYTIHASDDSGLGGTILIEAYGL